MAENDPKQLLGNTTVRDFRIGDDEVLKIYLGTTLIYDASNKPAAPKPVVFYPYDSTDEMLIKAEAYAKYDLYIDGNYITTFEN